MKGPGQLAMEPGESRDPGISQNLPKGGRSRRASTFLPWFFWLFSPSLGKVLTTEMSSYAELMWISTLRLSHSLEARAVGSTFTTTGEVGSVSQLPHSRERPGYKKFR